MKNKKSLRLLAVLTSMILTFSANLTFAETAAAPAVDVSSTTGLENTNQDIFYTGVDRLTLKKVSLNGTELTQNYKYYAAIGRLVLDDSYFTESGDYAVSAVFEDDGGNETTINSTLTIKSPYIYYNNFDEYGDALADDVLGKAIGSGVTGISEIAPEWSYIPKDLRTYVKGEYRMDQYGAKNHGDAGKLQNRIVDYTKDGVASKGITLEGIDSSYNWGGYKPSITLDVDRVYGNVINNETLGSDKLNMAFDVTFNYEAPEYLQTFEFSIDNSLNYSSASTYIMTLDPVWGYTFSFKDNTGRTKYYMAYEKESGKAIGQGLGSGSGRTPWYQLENYTDNIEFTLDMADMSALKLYVMIDGVEYEFEQYYTDTEEYVTDESGEHIVTDYIPLPNDPLIKTGYNALTNYFDIPFEWLKHEDTFPHGYNGLTMLKFKQYAANNPIVIDNILVQPEISKIKTEISKISDCETYEQALSAAAEVNAKIATFSERDKSLINNTKLLEIEDMYGKADTSLTTGLTNTNQDIFYEKVEGMTVAAVLINNSEISKDLYKYDANTLRLTLDDSIFATAGDYLVETRFKDAADNESVIKSTLTIKNQYVYINDFDGYDATALANDPFGAAVGSETIGPSTIAPEWSHVPMYTRYNDGTIFRYWYASQAGKLQNRIVDYEVDGKATKGIELEVRDPSYNVAGDVPSITLDLDRAYGDVINNETLGADMLNFAYRMTFGYIPEDDTPRTFGFSFNNAIHYGSWNDMLLCIDPNWGVTMSYNDINGKKVEYRAYEKITGNSIGDGIGAYTRTTPWYLKNNSTAYVEMSLDMSDMSALKLYMKINGVEYEFEQYSNANGDYIRDENGKILRTDYIPLPNKSKHWAGTTVDNFFGIISGNDWINQMFPYGSDGLTMLKFKSSAIDEPVIIDDVSVQSEVNRIKTEISKVSDLATDVQKAAAADIIWADYMKLSERDKGIVNNVGLLKYYDLFGISQASLDGTTVTAKIDAVTDDSYKVVVSVYENNTRFTTLKEKVIVKSEDLENSEAIINLTEVPEGAVVKVMVWNSDLSAPLCGAVVVQ